MVKQSTLKHNQAVHVITDDFDPEHISAVFGFKWRYDRYIDLVEDKIKTKIDTNVLIFVLVEGEKETMELTFNKKTSLLTILTHLEGKIYLKGSSLQVMKNITNIICNEEFKIIIFESCNNQLCSVIEVKRREYDKNSEAIFVTANLNLDKTDYENNYKNW